MQRRNRKQFRIVSEQIDNQVRSIDNLLSKLRKNTVSPVLVNIDNLNPCLPSKVNKPSNIPLLDLSSRGSSKSESTLAIEQSELYTFSSIFSQDTEEMLLESYSKKKYDPDYITTKSQIDPVTIKAGVRSNWIQRYLDEGDCSLFLEAQDGLLQIIGVGNGIVSYMTQNHQYQKMSIEDIYHCANISVKFDKHTQMILLNMVQGTRMVYQMVVQKDTRVIVEASNGQENGMERIVVLKVEKEERKEGFQVFWGSYFLERICEDVKFEKGKYIIMSLGAGNIQKIQLLLQDPQILSFKAAPFSPYKTKALLLHSFPECISQKSVLPSDRQIKQQFFRSVHMDIGLVIQIYQNIYLYQTKFQDEENVKEDIKLLFEELYTKHQKENRLRRGERMVKFYGIQATPACLYVPRKQVRTGSRLMENFKCHSVFK